MPSPLVQWPEAKYWNRPWNPIIGCRPVSAACEHCYARTLVERFNTTSLRSAPPSFRPTATGRENPPRKGVVFCGNMTDLFGDWVRPPLFSCPWNYIGQTAGAVGKAVYLWCTKRVDRLAEAIDLLPDDVDWSNQFFGFTGENQEVYDGRFRTWRTYFPRRGFGGWLSAEPLLGPLNLGLGYIAPEDMPFEWVVVGCESGRGRRPCKIEWVESVVAQCRARCVPVFVKQLDIGGRCENDITKFPEHLRIRQIPWEGLIHA